MNPFRPIIGPAVAAVKRVEVADIPGESVLGEFRATFLEAEVCKYAEPKPIRIGHATSVS